MPCLPIRFSDQEIAPIRAYARMHQLPVSSAVRQLIRLGLARTRSAPAPKIEVALIEQIAHRQAQDAHRLDDLINLCVQLLTITRVFAQATDPKLLDHALHSAKQLIADLNARKPTSSVSALPQDQRSVS
jgi:hypothetical protein